ncbi:MAG: archaeosortase/exosortase family protein, partial [Phycisphaerales bacterium]
YKGEDIPLNVAEQCSGMRMVVAFLALSAVMSLQNRFWWQRIALILLATPVAVFLNVIRVGVLGLASLYSRGLATGDAHMLIGTLLLVPGLFLFLACSWSLEKMIVDEKGAST